MATETVAADQVLTTQEQVDKKMSEEVKATQPDSVSLPNGTEEERPKTEDPASLSTPSEPECVNDKKIELPVVESEKTTDVPLVEDEPDPDAQAPEIEKKVPDAAESPAEVQSPIESVEVIEAPKEPATDITEIGEVEQPKIVDAPQLSVEVIKKPEETLEVTSDKGLVATVVEEIKHSEPEFLEVQKPELSIAEVEGKPEEKSEQVEKKHDEVKLEELVQDETVKVEESVTDKVESTACVVEGKTETDDTPTLAVEEEPEQLKVTEEEKKPVEVGPEKSVEDEGVKDGGPAVGKVEEATLLEEGTTDKDDKPSLIPEDASLSREAEIEPRDEGDSPLPDLTEQVVPEDQKEELSGVHVVEKLAEEVAVQTEKVEEVNESGNVVPEDSTEPIKEDEKKELSEADVVEIAEKKAVELVGEKEVVTEERSIQPIIEVQKTALSGADGIEKPAEDTVEKLEKVEEEITAKIVETEGDDKRDVITEDSIQPIEEDQKKELGGVDVVEKLAEKAAEKVVPEDSGEPVEEEQEKQLSGVDAVEKLAEAVAAETEKSSEQNGTTNVITEVSTQQLEEEVYSAIPHSNVIEKSFEVAGKDVQPVVENEHIADESVEAVKEPVTDSKQSEAEVKGEETAKTDDDTLEKVGEDVAKSDENVEPPPTKDGDETNPSEGLPKEVPAKPSSKQANGILSKVKQSLVKAKKVITGKSPSSKTPASGTKEEIKVK